ncbi:MAG: hypothetical protein CL575_10810 [Altererythrobacter sp.]|nr:hypothetical protein [Altererythrobacter sp.]MBK63409.1 hypothetical protein [Altererythrobacter sp.]|tara:strand:+ start:284 stop:667 length:384 start_codon:yes stop_codon:yes gene_type:complete
MPITAAAALLIIAEGPVMVVSAPATDYDIGYKELVVGENHAAIDAIAECDEIPSTDPARQINLAVALARVGEYEAAQERFEAAARNADRYELETATGDWIDSRVLARRGLAMLDVGKFGSMETLAVR